MLPLTKAVSLFLAIISYSTEEKLKSDISTDAVAWISILLPYRFPREVALLKSLQD
jgi:hypothetical protein